MSGWDLSAPWPSTGTRAVQRRLSPGQQKGSMSLSCLRGDVSAYCLCYCPAYLLVFLCDDEGGSPAADHPLEAARSDSAAQPPEPVSGGEELQKPTGAGCTHLHVVQAGHPRRCQPQSTLQSVQSGHGRRSVDSLLPTSGHITISTEWTRTSVS